jgi:hypothetical protein
MSPTIRVLTSIARIAYIAQKILALYPLSDSRSGKNTFQSANNQTIIPIAIVSNDVERFDFTVRVFSQLLDIHFLLLP